MRPPAAIRCRSPWLGLSLAAWNGLYAAALLAISLWALLRRRGLSS